MTWLMLQRNEAEIVQVAVMPPMSPRKSSQPGSCWAASLAMARPILLGKLLEQGPNSVTMSLRNAMLQRMCSVLYNGAAHVARENTRTVLNDALPRHQGMSCHK